MASKNRKTPTGARLQTYLSNPGLRSKLPDSALTPELLRKRQANQRLNAPAAPGSSYTNRDLSHVLSALSTMQFGPQQTQLAQAQNQVDVRKNIEIPAWFDAYRNTLTQLRGQQQASAAAQQQSLQALTTQAAGDTGVPGNADPAAAARGQAAAQMRSAGIGNQAALAQNLGGLQGNFLSNLGALSQGQQQSALGDLFKRQSELDAQKQQLAAQMGAFKVSQRGQILSDEASNALKAALTGSQIGQNAAQTAATTENAKTAATNAKTRQLTAKTNAKLKQTAGYGPGGVSLNKYGYTYDEWAALSDGAKNKARVKTAASTGKARKPASGPGSLPAATESNAVSAINKYAQVLQNGTKALNPVTGKYHTYKAGDDALNYLLNVLHVDPHQLNVARSLASNKGKGIGKWGVGEAHKAGVHVGGNWDIVR